MSDVQAPTLISRLLVPWYSICSCSQVFSNQSWPWWPCVSLSTSGGTGLQLGSHIQMHSLVTSSPCCEVWPKSTSFHAISPTCLLPLFPILPQRTPKAPRRDQSKGLEHKALPSKWGKLRILSYFADSENKDQNSKLVTQRNKVTQ